MMRKKWTSSILFCLLTICCNAQTAGYKFYSLLDSVKTSGFYNIEIGPALSAKINTFYSDLRVVNAAGKWVPHVLHWPAIETSGDPVNHDLKFTKSEVLNSSTSLIIESRKEAISNLGIIIRNTAAERFCTLSGSDDQQKWFVINDSLLLNPLPGKNAVTSVLRINFPLSNYRFFKLVILNKNKDPFDIMQVFSAGAADLPTSLPPKFIQNPACSIEQKDSGKISYIKVMQQDLYHFDKINIKAAGVKYFSRKAELYIPSAGNHSLANPGQLWQSFTISNNGTLEYKLETTNAPEFYLLISNEDNLPLKITAVSTAADYRYLTAYLEKGQQYRLLMNNPSATPPNYDLAGIGTKISDSIPFIAFGNITAIKEPPAVIEKRRNDNWILWSAIIAALLILLLLTIKMVKEIDKRKQDDSI
jgi:hypothetical protein